MGELQHVSRNDEQENPSVLQKGPKLASWSTLAASVLRREGSHFLTPAIYLSLVLLSTTPQRKTIFFFFFSRGKGDGKRGRFYAR